MNTAKTWKKGAALAILALAAVSGFGETEARAQLFRNRGPYGGQYRVRIRERGYYYPTPVVVTPYTTTTYIRPAPVVVSETEYLQPAPVVQRRVYQPPPVVESRLIQPAPIVERRLIQPAPVVEEEVVQPAPVVERRTYSSSYPY